jgi:hypothetical protein
MRGLNGKLTDIKKPRFTVLGFVVKTFWDGFEYTFT